MNMSVHLESLICKLSLPFAPRHPYLHDYLILVTGDLTQGKPTHWLDRRRVLTPSSIRTKIQSSKSAGEPAPWSDTGAGLEPTLGQGGRVGETGPPGREADRAALVASKLPVSFPGLALVGFGSLQLNDKDKDKCRVSLIWTPYQEFRRPSNQSTQFQLRESHRMDQHSGKLISVSPLERRLLKSFSLRDIYWST